MNHNLLRPYSDICSPPRTAFLSFFSVKTDDFLFGPEPDGTCEPIVIYCQAALRSVSLKWSLHRTSLAKPFASGHAEANPANSFRIAINPKDLISGFYDLRVVLDTGLASSEAVEDRPVTGQCTFGWRVSEMPIRDTRPADFTPFWDTAKAKLACVPLDIRIESSAEIFSGEQIDDYNVAHACLPPDYDPKGHRTDQVESFQVSFAGPDGGRIYAWLAKPVGAGPFPAMIVLPGAGFSGRPRPLEHARHGYLAIDMQVHGQPVDVLQNPPLPGYNDDHTFDPKESYYFYNVQLRVLQAINFIVSRSDVDPKRIAVVGGSQGGRLGIIAAALDTRVRAVVAAIINSPNYPHLAWVSRSNRHSRRMDPTTKPGADFESLTDGMDIVGPPPTVDDPMSRCIAYYDPMNFAPDVHCHVLMNCGLIDTGSPPYGAWAVFNRLGTSEKSIVAMPGIAHDWSAEFDRRAWRWLEEVWKYK